MTVPRLIPMDAMPTATPRLLMNHLLTEELQATTPIPADPNPTMTP